MGTVNQEVLQYYRCPEEFVNFALSGDLSEDSGFFRFGKDALCFGESCSGFRARRVQPDLYDALAGVVFDGTSIQLPFDPSEVIDNLRRERYLRSDHHGEKKTVVQSAVRNAYYVLRPALPVSVRKHVQRMSLRGWDKLPFPGWPVDRTVENIVEKLLALSLQAHAVERIPFVWFWPEGAYSAAIVTHDVEALAGRDFCSELMDLDDSVGIKASFQIVPEERYAVPRCFLDSIRERGFEINVHDLNHDGRLFVDRQVFLQRAQRINRYGREFGAAGFRSGALYRNLEWFQALEFAYDMSVPNVGHLEAQRGGCCTVMPYFLGDILEIPVTMTQDYTLYYILKDYSIDLWKRQIELVIGKNGLISFIAHPDYIETPRERSIYEELLGYLARLRDEKRVWMTTPGEVNRWWRARSQMTIVRSDGDWSIEGPQSERARLAYAVLDGGHLSYEIRSAHRSKGVHA